MKTLIFNLLCIAVLVFTFCEARIIDNFNMKERFRDLDNYFSVTDIERDIDFNEEERELDVYYKKNEPINELKPVVIFIHGGTWYEGDRVKFTKFGSLLKDNGYIGVIPEYILYPHGHMDDMVYDVVTAIKWTYENISKYGGDPNNITVGGHSAGAHLLSLALVKSYFGIKNNGKLLPKLPKLQKIMLLAGIYDFDDFSLIKKYFNKTMDNSLLENFAKFIFKAGNVSPYDILKSYPEGYVQDSFNVNKFVIYHTSEDELVPIASSEKMSKELYRICGNNIDLQYILKEGYTHDQIAGKIRVDDKEQQDIFLSLIQL